jgi:two-component system, chemotaxis family, protein-glutamate methylesterase/glutaminase
MTLRVLVVDDTVTFRKILSDVLAEIPGVEVVGAAHHGKMALARIQTLQPDLVTLDIEMPEMDGLEVLQALRAQGSTVGVIMVSSFTRRGSELTLRALELGAFDFITKEAEGDFAQNREKIRSNLAPLVKAYAQRTEIRAILKGASPTPQERAASLPAAKSSPQTEVVPTNPAGPAKTRPELVLIGVSTGGPNALARVIPALPAGLGVPVLVVQHMPPIFTRTLAESLDKKSALRVKEAESSELPQPNWVYIAPGGKQMKVTLGPEGKPLIQITDDPPENNCKPSVDTLFRSAALHFPGRTCAVIMTGMGSDGTLGLRLIKRHPARVIAQDEASCVVFGMPKEAIAAGVVDIISPLEGIADEIRKAVQGPGSFAAKGAVRSAGSAA